MTNQLNDQGKACSMHKIKENIILQTNVAPQTFEKLCIVQKETLLEYSKGEGLTWQRIQYAS